MGKGQRSRDVRSQKKNNVAAKKAVNWKGTLAIVLVAAIVIGLAALIYINESGILLRGKVALKTENFEVNAAMLQYATMFTYQNFVTQYGDLVQYMGLDTSMPLAAQPYGEGTWLDYFRNSAELSMKETLVSAEAAKAAGLSLDEADYADIDASIEAIKQSYKAMGYSEKAALTMAFGKGVKWSDMRDLQEITVLANKYDEKVYEDTKAAVADADVEKYYDDHRDSYTSADVITYTETLKQGAEETTEDFEAKKEELLAKFNEIAANTEESAFGAALSEYLKTVKSTETEADSAYTGASKSVKSSSVDKDLASWLFELADGAYVRQAGEIKVTTTETEATDSAVASYAVTVTFVKATPTRDTSATKNVSHILFRASDFENDEAAKAEAERVLALYKSGEMTKESFDKLGEEYTADSSVFYENVVEGQMVDEFNEWLFSPKRKEGDVEIVKTEQYGYHIMYFAGEGEEKWFADCFNAIVSEKTEEVYAELEKTYVVTVNEKGLKAVKG